MTLEEFQARKKLANVKKPEARKAEEVKEKNVEKSQNEKEKV